MINHIQSKAQTLQNSLYLPHQHVDASCKPLTLGSIARTVFAVHLEVENLSTDM